MKSDVIGHIRLHPRFARLPTPLCTLPWQNWANMAQAAKNKNAPALQKWAFREGDCIPDTPQRKGVRVGWGAIWDNGLLKSKRLLQNLNSRIVFKQKQRRTYLEQVARFCIPKSMGTKEM